MATTLNAGEIQCSESRLTIQNELIQDDTRYRNSYYWGVKQKCMEHVRIQKLRRKTEKDKMKKNIKERPEKDVKLEDRKRENGIT
jgi:hypothetical protein